MMSSARPLQGFWRLKAVAFLYTSNFLDKGNDWRLRTIIAKGFWVNWFVEKSNFSIPTMFQVLYFDDWWKPLLDREGESLMQMYKCHYTILKIILPICNPKVSFLFFCLWFFFHLCRVPLQCCNRSYRGSHPESSSFIHHLQQGPSPPVVHCLED